MPASVKIAKTSQEENIQVLDYQHYGSDDAEQV